MDKQELKKKIDSYKIIGFDLMDKLTAHKSNVIQLEKQYNQIVGEIIRLNNELKALDMPNKVKTNKSVNNNKIIKKRVKQIKSIKPKSIKQVKIVKPKSIKQVKIVKPAKGKE